MKAIHTLWTATVLVNILLGTSYTFSEVSIRQEESGFLVAPSQVKIITHQAVAAQRVVIERYFEKNRTHRILVRAATVAAFAAVAGYAIYHCYLKDPVESTSVSVQDLTRLTESVESIDRKVMTVLKDKVPVPEAVAATTYTGKALEFGKELAVSGIAILKYCGNVMLTAGPPMLLTSLALREIPTVADLWGRFISAPVDKICHPSDSTWFLNNQVHYKNMLAHLEFRVASLPLAADDQERNYFVSQIVTDLNIFTDQLARIVAFLELQAERIFETNPICGQHLNQQATHVFGMIERFNHDLADLLPEKNMHAKVPATLASFQRKLTDELGTFDLYERAAFHDISL